MTYPRPARLPMTYPRPVWLLMTYPGLAQLPISSLHTPLVAAEVVAAEVAVAHKVAEVVAAVVNRVAAAEVIVPTSHPL